MAWSKSVYGDPDNFGLTLIGEVEWVEPCYSFNTTIVLKDDEGNLYWGSDSGCSCPSPFEEFTTIDSLDKGTAAELEKYLQSQVTEYSAGQVADLMLRVKNGLQDRPGWLPRQSRRRVPRLPRPGIRSYQETRRGVFRAGGAP